MLSGRGNSPAEQVLQLRLLVERVGVQKDALEVRIRADGVEPDG
jgi:hypothetical protein